MNTKILVDNAEHEKSFLITTHAGQAVLRAAKDSTNRPRCMCCLGKPEMYISRRGGKFYLARMPGSGNEHAEGCRSHLAEPFADASPEADELTAGELLEKLWSEVLQNGGPPKAFWSAIQWSVKEAASTLHADGRKFADQLLVPDTFLVATADNHKKVHAAYYARQAADGDKQVRYWTFGTLKDIVERQFSYQATLKHMPDTKFWVHKDLFEIFPPLPRPEGEMVICLFSCRRTPSGVEVDEAATLLLDDKFRPIDPVAWKPANLPFPSAPSDQQVEQARIRLGLPAGAGRDAVFGTLVEQLISN